MVRRVELPADRLRTDLAAAAVAVAVVAAAAVGGSWVDREAAGHRAAGEDIQLAAVECLWEAEAWDYAAVHGEEEGHRAAGPEEHKCRMGDGRAGLGSASADCSAGREPERFAKRWGLAAG